MRYNTGAKQDPCGISTRIGLKLDNVVQILTLNNLFRRKPFIVLVSGPKYRLDGIYGEDPRARRG